VTSARKVAANRRNAKASTGPRSPQGKARSAQNAHKHGLTLPVGANPQAARAIESLTHAIAGAAPRVLAPQGRDPGLRWILAKTNPNPGMSSPRKRGPMVQRNPVLDGSPLARGRQRGNARTTAWR
jgi:hypothetical protein